MNMTTKHDLTICLFAGLTTWLLAVQPAAGATTRKSANSKATASSTSAAPARTGAISRDPYVGAIAMDAASGQVLCEDRADLPGYPASVLKLMDLLIVLEKVKQGRLSLQEPVTVSARAAKIGGSQVWLAEKEVFTVDELLYALMVQSANDAAAALAEKVAGTPEAFVGLMNQRARELGLAHTEFHSVHGLPPGAGQQPDVTTARDFALLCRELVKHPDALRYTATRERPFRPNAGPKTVVMRTHNHLLGQVEGCDGLKTGYFFKAGFSIALTASRQGQRVVVVVLGSTDRKARDAKAAELLAKGFAALSANPPPAPSPVPGARSK